MQGKELLNKVASLSELPSDLLQSELTRLLDRGEMNESNLTLEELREVLAEYLQDVFVAAKRDLG